MTENARMDHEPLMRRALARRAAALHPVESPVAIDLSTPASEAVHPLIRDAVANALEHGETHYTARTGIEPLRQRIAERSSVEGFPARPEQVVVTNGGSEALFIALQTLAAAEGRVVLVEPVTPLLTAVARFTGMTGDIVMCTGAARLDDAVAVVVSTASGVCGRMLADDELAGTLETASRHGVTVIVDRSSAPDCYVARPPFSRPELAAGAITVGSFSGAYGLAGWRAGYFSAPAALMDRLAGLKESMSISTTTPTQFAMLAALEHADTLLADARTRFAERRDRVVGLLDAAGLAHRLPDVYPGLLIDIGRSGLSDAEFARSLEASAAVRVEPVSRYGTSLAGHVRIDLRASDDALDAGLTRLAAYMAGDER